MNAVKELMDSFFGYFSPELHPLPLRLFVQHVVVHNRR